MDLISIRVKTSVCPKNQVIRWSTSSCLALSREEHHVTDTQCWRVFTMDCGYLGIDFYVLVLYLLSFQSFSMSQLEIQ